MEQGDPGGTGNGERRVWPDPPSGSLRTVRKQQGGRPAGMWCVTGAPGSWVIHVWESTLGTTAIHRSRSRAQPEDALTRACPDALALHAAGTALEIWVDGGPPAQAAMAAAIGRNIRNQELILRIAAERAGEPDEIDVLSDPLSDTDEDAEIEDDDYEDDGDVYPYDDDELVPVAARVNGQPVVGITRIGDKALPHPVTVLFDDVRELVPRRVMAEFSWTSESGGGPISWEGRLELSQVGDGVALQVTGGDEGETADLVAFRESPAGIAALVCGWLPYSWLVPAALWLEPLDPEATLSARATKRWQKRISEVLVEYAYLEFNLDGEALNRVTARLKKTRPSYARTANALANPKTEGGRALAAALDETGRTGDHRLPDPRLLTLPP